MTFIFIPAKQEHEQTRTWANSSLAAVVVKGRGLGGEARCPEPEEPAHDAEVQTRSEQQRRRGQENIQTLRQGTWSGK